MISFYQGQVRLIQQECQNNRLQYEVNSVDGFQGREKEIIILSCVRSRGNQLGFLEDQRRLNVSITRAKFALIIIGNFETLSQNQTWSSLIEKIR